MLKTRQILLIIFLSATISAGLTYLSGPQNGRFSREANELTDRSSETQNLPPSNQDSSIFSNIFSKSFFENLFDSDEKQSENKSKSGIEQKGSSPASNKWQEILNRGEIRCGFIYWPPFLQNKPINDENNQQESNHSIAEIPSGLYADLFERIAEKMKVKISWHKIENLESIENDFAKNRYDIFCTPLISSIERAQKTYISQPFFFVPLYLYGDKKLRPFENCAGNAVQYESLKIALLPSSANQETAKNNIAPCNHFEPVLTSNDLETNYTPLDMLSMVHEKNADLALVDRKTWLDFNQMTQHNLKQLSDTPLQIKPLSVLMPYGSIDLKLIIDQAILEIATNGELEQLYQDFLAENNYEPAEKILLLPSLANY